MASKSKIEWTDATWNPVRGCTKVSEGCRNCYAETFAERWRGIPGHAFEQGFDLKLVPEKLLEPLKWKKPRQIFVNSMSDLFHKDIPDEYLDKVFAVMALCPQHTFQILTKRPERMYKYLSQSYMPGRICDAAINLGHENKTNWHLGAPKFPFPNVWLGVTVENQKAADERIPYLIKTPAAKRFLSIEPLLGPVDLTAVEYDNIVRIDCLEGLCGWPVAHAPFEEGNKPIDWVIVGGESGPDARPMHPEWARLLRDQCQAAGVPFFFKQWGQWQPTDLDYEDTKVYDLCDGRKHIRLNLEGGQGFHGEKCVVLKKMAHKQDAGRVLDGRTWDETPVERAGVNE